MTAAAANIRTTIATTLSEEGVNLDSYGHYIDLVVDALTEREHYLTDAITERVTEEFGVRTEQVREELTSIGALVRPIPEPEPVVEEVPAEPQTTDEKVEALTRTVSDLAGVVGQLVTLAQNKLGVTL